MVRTLAASALATAALLIAVGSAGAHPGQPGPTTSAQPAPPLPEPVAPIGALRAAGPAAAPLPLLVVAAAVGVAACASRRRLAVALVLVTAVVGANAAFHSVHHLNDPDAGATCVLASGVSHSPAVLTDGAPAVVTPAAAPERHAATGPTGAGAAVSRPDRGRAPPSSSVV
jgi:hypothetical protein